MRLLKGSLISSAFDTMQRTKPLLSHVGLLLLPHLLLLVHHVWVVAVPLPERMRHARQPLGRFWC